jgi:hypothetical protein
LKSRLMVWRSRKGRDGLDVSCCESLNHEGHDLEEHILWELNVRVSDFRDGDKLVPRTSMESCASVET